MDMQRIINSAASEKIEVIKLNDNKNDDKNDNVKGGYENGKKRF
jgi:hypothetical protein